MTKTNSNSDNNALVKTYKDNSKDDISLVAIYGYGIIVMPKLPVCDQYRVPMNKYRASNFIKKHFGIKIEFDENFKRPIILPTKGTTSYANLLKESWIKHFSEKLLNNEIKEINKDTFFTVVETELNKYNLSFELSKK